MALDIPLILGLSGIFILIGYVSDYIFRRFGFPDVIILLAIGVLLGPVFGVVDRADIIDFAPLLSALVITIILFDGGLNMNYQRVLRGSGRAIILAATGVALTMVVTALVTSQMLGWKLEMGILMGAIIGGTSAAIVIPLANKITTNQKTSTLLSLESAYTDVIVIMVVLGIIQLMTIQTNPDVLSFVSRGLVNGFLIGAAIGIIGGIAWMRALTAMRTAYEDILTLAIAFVMYGITEFLGGSGPVAALAFGITFGNASRIFRSLKQELPLVRDTTVEVSAKKFHSQISFMVRAIFFVFLGLIISVNNTGLIIAGIIIALTLFFARIGASWISTYKDQELRKDVWLISFMLPRGLAVAVAALLPFLYNVEGASVFTDIAFLVIVVTVAITGIGVNALRKSSSLWPAVKTATGSFARTEVFKKSMIFTAVGFAVVVAGVLAYNGVTGGELFGKFTPTSEQGNVAELSVKPLGIERTFFFDSSSTEKNAIKQFGASNVLSYKWEFGDGFTSSQKQVIHQYSEAGVYIVKVTIVREDSRAYSENMVLTVQ
ncbi:MAG: cation:proton antiporter [Nitrososphaerales archaeon]